MDTRLLALSLNKYNTNCSCLLSVAKCWTLRQWQREGNREKGIDAVRQGLQHCILGPTVLRPALFILFILTPIHCSPVYINLPYHTAIKRNVALCTCIDIVNVYVKQSLSNPSNDKMDLYSINQSFVCKTSPPGRKNGRFKIVCRWNMYTCDMCIQVGKLRL